MPPQSLKFWRSSAPQAPSGTAHRRRIERRSLAALAVLLAVAAALTGWISGLLQTPSSRYGEAPPAPTINDYRVGAIMFVEPKGVTCEIYRFDNLTGGVVYDGNKSCEKKLNPAEADAFAPGTERRSRMNSVLGGFRK